ncbi:unnamed protein product (macronuclear) [Paramecium tetraurelia]|uniref:Uncharacterized protein n=1 Tax=Paramecium tetraurelia TaxID=5888 RepID=A0DRB4_PARTE|nr:uncharacterized protein GSPATT00019298001 [Paramecium tetraurelia]CAK85581.1 unnamed protein product [Paramecium tetraurelia]|eukprot:XP_001452978.1 hypothetical protein (macronuclear) [Paramecium tetraurelia strain d4-2]
MKGAGIQIIAYSANQESGRHPSTDCLSSNFEVGQAGVVLKRAIIIRDFKILYSIDVAVSQNNDKHIKNIQGYQQNIACIQIGLMSYLISIWQNSKSQALLTSGNRELLFIPQLIFFIVQIKQNLNLYNYIF